MREWMTEKQQAVRIDWMCDLVSLPRVVNSYRF